MAKLLSLTLFATLAISMVSTAPASSQGSVVQSADNDLLDAKNLDLNVDLLDNILRRDFVHQKSDNDAVDAKNTKVNVNALNSSKKKHSTSGHESGSDRGQSHQKTNSKAVQSSDSDLVDLKNLVANVNVLNRRGNVYQYSDNDLLDLKHLDIELLNSYCKTKAGGHHSHHKKHSFRGNNGRVVQYSDDDLIDLKNLGVDVDALNSVEGKKSVLAREDSDPYWTNPNELIDKRSNVDEAFDILRRANYDVDSLTLTKRGKGDMWQFDRGDHTCFCAKRESRSCDSNGSAKSLKVAATPKAAAHHKHAQPKATPAASSTHRHPHHEHSSHSSSSTSTLQAEQPMHTHEAPQSCSSGYSHAGKGDVIHSSDNDVADLKNIKIIINILNGAGLQTASKTVAEDEKPICEGAFCCYKSVGQEKEATVTQKSDDDLLDLKDTTVGVDLLKGLL